MGVWQVTREKSENPAEELALCTQEAEALKAQVAGCDNLSICSHGVLTAADGVQRPAERAADRDDGAVRSGGKEGGDGEDARVRAGGV